MNKNVTASPSVDEMMDAVKTNDISKVSNLLESNLSLATAPTETGDTPLMISVYYGAKDITELLLSSGANLSLFEAAATGRTERVREILEEEPERLNSYSHDGWTALHLAAFFGPLETVEYLLSLGADWTLLAQNGMGNMPLHAALAARRHEAAKILLVKHGTDINLPDKSGWTPLHLAAANGDQVLAEVLVTRGADLNALNNNGQTPLDLAQEHGQAEIAAMLKRF